MSVTSLINKFLYKLTNKTLNSLEHRSIVTTSKPKLTKPLVGSTGILFENACNTTTYTPFFSKSVSNLHKNLSLLNPSLNVNTNKHNLLSNLENINLLTLKPRTTSLKTFYTQNSFTQNEAYYKGSDNLNNLKIKNAQINLNDLYRTFMSPLCPTTFNFNIENNLSIAKQQR
jgi:hypothetical protein